MMKYKTAAYTICYNEKRNIERWLHYTKDFDYRVLLDTGSTDGTYEELKKVSNVIIEQKRFHPFRFDVHRNYNLSMIPHDAEWCFSPDMDEWFSINVLEELEKTLKKYPNMTNMSTTRLDLYTKNVFVGPPKFIPSNKIHLRTKYYWYGYVYEHLRYYSFNKIEEVEIYNENVFLIHDQDINKPRNILYPKLMEEAFLDDPDNEWNNWYLLNHYYREKNKEKYIPVALNFLRVNGNSGLSKDCKMLVFNDLKKLYEKDFELDTKTKKEIEVVLKYFKENVM